ncbi:MAG: DUF177 domain-containing protein [Bacteroidales bacterium]|nr:DUF177 domain-containing protein [Bacteroidales bacterium]
MKGYWKQFMIPFKGLKEGKHEFRFKIDEMFFEALDYSTLENGNVQVLLEMDKKTNMLVFNFNIGGTIRLKCDRCLEEYDQPVEGQYMLIVKFSERENNDLSEDIVILPDDAHEFDVGHYIYEYISLLLPIKHVHEHESDCNQDMITKLNIESNENLSSEKIDERWKALEEIRNKMNNN